MPKPSQSSSHPISLELMVTGALAPLLATPLLNLNVVRLQPRQLFRCWLAMEVPFIVIPLALYGLYSVWLGRQVARAERPLHRWALHGVALLFALVVGFVIRPLHGLVLGTPTSALGFSFVTVVFTSALVVPAVLIHDFRKREWEIKQRAEQLQQAVLKAQLEALQARTNPHFLFNSINTVKALISENPVLAEELLERMAELFRHALASNDGRLVPLRREVELAWDYLAIQQARFGAGLALQVSVDDGAGDIEVPPLLIQPLLENAIEHGTATRGGGAVSLAVRRDGARVWIEVTDDGPGPGASTHNGTQTSLRELKARLQLLYAERATFEMVPSAGGGCVARIGLPEA